MERCIRTERGRFAELLGGRPRARILIEASTEGEWVVRCLEGLGHEVVVGDPDFSPLYATRSRRVKTDRRDARTLAVREALVRTRARYIPQAHALVRLVDDSFSQALAVRLARLRTS